MKMERGQQGGENLYGGPVTVTMVVTYLSLAWVSKKDWYAEPLA